jgi:tetratricopeptide (TPR) repeat protein
LLAGCKSRPGVVADASVPKPGEATYADAVSAFYAAVIAVQVNDSDKLRVFSEKATTLAPGEPAAWANQALGLLRSQQPELADASLKKAEALAPGDARIRVLRGLVQEAMGKFDDALKTYQEAARSDSGGVEALYQVTLAADRAKGPDEFKIKIATNDEILKRRPGNVAALLHLIEAFAGAQDKAGIEKFLPELTKRTALWPSEARVAVETFAKALPTLDGRALRLGFNAVRARVIRTDDYSVALRDLGKATYLQGAPAGSPITTPLKLVVPPPSPAAPDTGLSFVAAPLAPAATTTLALPLDEKSAPAVAIATPTGLTLDGKASVGGGSALKIAALDIDDEVGKLKNSENPRPFRLDLAVAGPGGLRLYKSGPSGPVDVTAASGLPASVTGGPMSGVWSIDFEADGDLDLIACPASGAPLVLQNNGNGKFAPLAGKLGGIGTVKDLAWADFDSDGDPDLSLLESTGKVQLLANQRGGLFEPWGSFPPVSGQAALAVAEVTNDASLDLLTLGTDGSVSVHSFREGKWTEPARLGKSGVAKPSRLIAEDLDNNGGVDLLVAGEGKSEALLGGADGTYPTAGLSLPLTVDSVADLDGDGVLDLVGRSDRKAVKALAKPTRKYGYQTFTLKAIFPNDEPGSKVNIFATGGELEVRAGLWYRKMPLTGPQVHVGLGERKQLDVARIIWPNGNPQGEFADDMKDPAIVRDQKLGGSCPFLFTWNGREFAFVTDCIWRSPLGLKINAQTTAGTTQTEDWVKVRSDQLAPKDGFYDLRITAELRETHYFDQVSLMAVDHPEGTDIWVDERFLPTKKPLLKVIPTKSAQALAAAIGFDGKDVAKTLAERDGVYLDDFGRGQYQGVTKDHWVELVLPESAPRGVPLFLIAHGWLHPTDSSINVALGQNSSHPAPQGLSLETPNAAGVWSVAKPGLGFPEGKLKTIVLRIDDAFQAGAARKVRLRTNLEVFWDQIRWAEGLPGSVARSTRLPLSQAELRYRGFSKIVAKDASSPELPKSYDDLDGGGPRWRDLVGCYTRFGDVNPLLGRVDDRYVIMNAGDEMALRFRELPAPSRGFKRDFVVIADGWEKDGNVNTEWGQTVHPLPAHTRTSYPRPGALEDDPVFKAHREDFLTYHTRYVSDRAFSEGMRP